MNGWIVWSFALCVSMLGCGGDGGGGGGADSAEDSGSDAAQDVPVPDGASDADGGGMPDSGSDASDGGGDDGGVDAVPDGGTPGPSLPVLHVHSPDGSTVGVLFGRPVEPASAGDASAYTLRGASGGERAVASVQVQSAYAVLALNEPLGPSETWELTIEGVVGADGERLEDEPWTGPVKATLTLNLVWHQHQPSYLDPGKDELQGPWVRKHATKDYFDMTAILANYPAVHVNVNLTSSLLNQLDLYLDRLGPYVDLEANTVDEAGFLAAWEGHTDPWVDLLLRDTPEPAEASELERARYYEGVWSTKSIAEPLRAFFPEYEALALKAPASLTQLDLLHLKLWFELAWMDPDFLRGPVVVFDDATSGPVVVDLSDVVVESPDGTFTLSEELVGAELSDVEKLARGEELANRLVAENYKIMRGVFDIHTKLGYANGQGQVEVLTTPFFHPILPLLFDTDLAAEGQPSDPLPAPAFAHPEDVHAQIEMAVAYYSERFGHPPRGMWPSEGAVAEEVLPALRANGIDWIATDRQVLQRGKPGATHLVPYRVDTDTVAGDGGDATDEMMIVFRDTELSDKVGFAYQSNPGAVNAEDFLMEVFDTAPRFGEADRLLSVILDGENAWEWYTQDHDAKEFLHALYAALTTQLSRGAVVTVTGAEYVEGNAARGVGEHAVSAMEEYEDLFPGSWIGGRLDTWIGELEENLAWAYVRTARDAIAGAAETLEGVLPPPADLLHPPSGGSDAELAWWRAWRAIYSAEGSDWFWWYGGDQTAAGGDDGPFDDIFRAQLGAMYAFMNDALVLSGFPPVEVPGLPPILQPPPSPLKGAFAKAPTLDGMFVPDLTEWVPPAGQVHDNDTSGAIADPSDDIARVLYGFSNQGTGAVYVAVELKEDLSAKLGTDYRLSIYTNHGNVSTTEEGKVVTGDPFNLVTEEGVPADFQAGGTARQVRLELGSGELAPSVWEADGAGGWTNAGEHSVEVGGPVPGGGIVEVKIPLDTLGMSKGDPFEFMVVAVDGGEAIDRVPNLGSIIVFPDPTKLVQVTFELDCTASQIPLDEYVSIQNPPPPAGTGQASIVGNRPEFADWTPNSVFMKDDGVAPDFAPEDNIWTISFPFSPGTDLQYKYTIGDSGSSWGGTEEYPLTNRGYVVPIDGSQAVRIRDVFADRPDPSGSMGALTTVTVEGK